MQTTGGKGLRPVDRYMMYTDIDIEYHSQCLTTFNLTVNKSIILTHARRKYLYCRAYPYTLQGTVKIPCISWDSSTRVHHWVMALRDTLCRMTLNSLTVFNLKELRALPWLSFTMSQTHNPKSSVRALKEIFNSFLNNWN